MKLGFAKNLTRTAIASTLAASLALTPMTAQPARADDAANAIAAATFFTLLLGGIAIASSQDRNRRGGWDDGGHHNNRAKVLPSECALVVLKGQKRNIYYRAGCLRNSFANWRQLPDQCFERLDVRGSRDIRAYKGRCLERFGYREEGRGGRWN